MISDCSAAATDGHGWRTAALPGLRVPLLALGDLPGLADRAGALPATGFAVWAPFWEF